MPSCGRCGRRYPAGELFCSADGFELLPDDGPPPARGDEHDPIVGQVLGGRFRVEAAIGHGGMGQVYAARHEVLGRRFAVKVLLPSLDADPRSVRRFLREADAISRVVHPNVVAMTDFGRAEDGRYYLVMEYLDGETLARRLRRQGRPAPDLALLWLGQLVAALEAAHAERVVHRDLKPSNLMLVPAGRARELLKVLDFGLARDLSTDKTLTSRRQIIGTPGYLAPEQIRKEPVDERTDVYAVGCIGYELLTGAPPFSGSMPSVLRAHLEDAPARPDTEGRLAEGLWRVLARCLAKSPDQRFPTAAALAGALESLVGERPRQASDRTAPPRRRRSSAQRPPDPREDTAPGAEPGAPGNTLYLGDVVADLERLWQRKLVEVAALHSGGGVGFGEVARRLSAVQRVDAEVSERETQIALLRSEIEEQELAAIERAGAIRTAIGRLAMQRSSCIEVLDAIRRDDLEALHEWLGRRGDAPGERSLLDARVEVEQTLEALGRQRTELEARLIEVESEREQTMQHRRAALHPQEERLSLLQHHLRERTRELRAALDRDASSSPTPGYAKARGKLEEVEAQLGSLGRGRA